MKWPLSDFDQKHVVFIGRGREGQSFERFIARHGNTASFRFIDRSDGPDYLESLAHADMETTVVVKTPGCPGSIVPVPYTTATNVFLSCVRELGAEAIGVTGTKGKSTTTAMIGSVLRAHGRDAIVCGNIGIPMLDVLDRDKDAPDAETVFVVELSSYQLDDVTASPHLAVITNLYEDHIPYHGSLQAYWDAKRNILRHMGSADTVVYNPQFDLVASWVRESSCRMKPIDPHAAIDMADWKIWGDHNRLNALLAVAVTGMLGVPEESALRTLREFEPLPHRLQCAGCINGVSFIDNSIGGNPAATVAAMAAVNDAGKTLGCMIVGGVDRNYDFRELAQAICDHGVQSLVLLPHTGHKIRDALPKGCNVNCQEVDSIDDAVRWAAKNCGVDTVCLLSPASPAQVISKDFEELGVRFSISVLALLRDKAKRP